MDIQFIGRYLRRVVETNAGTASKAVAEELRDQIQVNSKLSKGFAADPYKVKLAQKTIKKKKKAGTYRGPNSTLRDADSSILRLKTVQRGKVSTIDFRSTGKGELFFAHHHGINAPKPYEKWTAQRSLIPVWDTSIPYDVHHIAARAILPDTIGFPIITIRNSRSEPTYDDYMEQAPF